MKPTLRNLFPQNYHYWIISISLIVATVLLFLGGPDYHSPRSFAAFWNLGHIGYFILASYALTRWKRINCHSPVIQWLLVLAITMIVGILIEVLQSKTQRTPDIVDVVRDLTGSFLFLSFRPAYSTILHYKKRLSFQAAAIILLFVQLQPLVISLFDEITAWQQFPILSDFETPFELDRWQGNADMAIKNIPSIANGNILEISLSTIRFSGVELKYFPGDWRDYKTLKFNVYNPQTRPLFITCRIHDRQHAQGVQRYSDRFNHQFFLSQGWNQIEIKLTDVLVAPKHREMDLGQILGFGIFATSVSSTQVIYLDNLRLSP